jgi:hypothetical protein
LTWSWWIQDNADPWSWKPECEDGVINGKLRKDTSRRT